MGILARSGKSRNIFVESSNVLIGQGRCPNQDSPRVAGAWDATLGAIDRERETAAQGLSRRPRAWLYGRAKAIRGNDERFLQWPRCWRAGVPIGTAACPRHLT